MSTKNQGLYDKYEVKRRDGRSISPRVIVFELDDPRTWPALRVFADSVEKAGNSQFAADIREQVEFYERLAP